MPTLVTLTIGEETWEMQRASLMSLRIQKQDLRVHCYFSLGQNKDAIIDEIKAFKFIPIDIGQPGLLALVDSREYSGFNSMEFDIKTSFKWLAILKSLTDTEEPVIFLDSDITICKPLPLKEFEEIWKHFPIFVQDEGLSVFPKHACTGLMGFNYSDLCLRFLKSAHYEQSSKIVSNESVHDQTIFNGMIAADLDLYKQIYYLPQCLFPVGYMGPIYKAFSNNEYRALLNLPEKPILYHANWAVGYQDKLKLMGSISLPQTELSGPDTCKP